MDERTPQDRAAAYRRSAAIYRQLASETQNERIRRHLEGLAHDCEEAARPAEVDEEVMKKAES